MSHRPPRRVNGTFGPLAVKAENGHGPNIERTLGGVGCRAAHPMVASLDPRRHGGVVRIAIVLLRVSRRHEWMVVRRHVCLDHIGLVGAARLSATSQGEGRGNPTAPTNG